jgi:hypothetical protein|tara:strand:+ start:193 stop:297 length:105 start_codon:yes stop_codon:yes gene_type:complete
MPFYVLLLEMAGPKPDKSEEDNFVAVIFEGAGEK